MEHAPGYSRHSGISTENLCFPAATSVNEAPESVLMRSRTGKPVSARWMAMAMVIECSGRASSTSNSTTSVSPMPNVARVSPRMSTRRASMKRA